MKRRETTMAHSQPASIENHPQLQKITDALLQGKKPREIERWTKPRISHVSIWRYWRNKVQPALERAKETAQVLATKDEKRSTNELQNASESAARDLTRVALADEPIVRRADLLWNEAISSIEETRFHVEETPDGEVIVPADLKARAALLGVANKTLETYAKAQLHPGFVPAATPTGTTNNLIVLMPSDHAAAPEVPERRQLGPGDVEIIDVD